MKGVGIGKILRQVFDIFVIPYRMNLKKEKFDSKEARQDLRGRDFEPENHLKLRSEGKSHRRLRRRWIVQLFYRHGFSFMRTDS